jgi:hypothetical protein
MGIFEWDCKAAGRPPTSAEFEQACVVPNVPGIVRNFGPPNGEILDVLKHLLHIFGDQHLVPVVGEVGSCAAHVSLADFLKRHHGERVLQQCLSGEIPRADATPRVETGVYLKDWHLCAALASVRGMSNATAAQLLYGGHPLFLGDHDWLNDYCDEAPSETSREMLPRLGGGAGHDYRFCYIGDTGTWTPLHVDVYGSYSWSLNLAGEKDWYFALPNDFATHFDAYFTKPGTFGCAMPVDARCSTFRFHHVRQRSGDLVFVPSMYLHQVHNATPAISVNHNWCNRHNALAMVRGLAGECRSIEHMVDDDARSIFVAEGSWDSIRDKMLQGSGGWSVATLLAYFADAEKRYPACQATAATCATAREMLKKL